MRVFFYEMMNNNFNRKIEREKKKRIRRSMRSQVTVRKKRSVKMARFFIQAELPTYNLAIQRFLNNVS